MPNYFYRVHKVCSVFLNTLCKARMYSSLESTIHYINWQFLNSCKFDTSTSFRKQWFDFHLLWFGPPKSLLKCLKAQLYFVSLLAIIFMQIAKQNKNFIARQNKLQKFHMEIKSFNQSLPTLLLSYTPLLSPVPAQKQFAAKIFLYCLTLCIGFNPHQHWPKLYSKEDAFAVHCHLFWSIPNFRAPFLFSYFTFSGALSKVEFIFVNARYKHHFPCIWWNISIHRPNHIVQCWIHLSDKCIFFFHSFQGKYNHV